LERKRDRRLAKGYRENKSAEPTSV
jgi:hypothetical protein